MLKRGVSEREHERGTGKKAQYRGASKLERAVRTVRGAREGGTKKQERRGKAALERRHLPSRV